MPEAHAITAIILAGGKNTRMNTDKGLVNFGGKMLVEQVIGALRKITPTILIITPNPAYRQFGYPCLEDEIKEKGPLGGIFTGLSHSSTQKNLVVGCDMPFLTVNVIQGLINQSRDEDVVFSEHLGKAEPLCAIYDRNCIPHFRLMLEQSRLKITDATAGLTTRVINFDEEDWFRGNEFANINSPEELKKYS
jgi:molybdopterin-guanine dinucleotide biosynthesis protein A